MAELETTQRHKEVDGELNGESRREYMQMLLSELRALERMAKRTFSILVALEPAIGALVGVILLDQRLGAVSFLGVAMVVAAGVGATATAPADQPPLLPESA